MSFETKPQFEPINNGLLVRAPAKINLSLLIAGKRKDGFHEIETLMSKINWYDELYFEPADKDGIELICKGDFWAPDGEENLVYQACHQLFQVANIAPRIKVTLTKNIPAGTGLGSASSDAVAALIGLNRFANLNVEKSEIFAIASNLGSDIPFFLGGPLAFCTGRGEIITELNTNFNFKAALIVPDVSSSTPKVYGNYTHDSEIYSNLSPKINRYISTSRIDLVIQLCANMLETSCLQLYNKVDDIIYRLRELRPGRVCLSGSGSTIYTMIPELNNGNAEDFKAMLLENIDGLCKVVGNNRW
jgi:4-diphosphocytidyl-2-C-methyl-D-erythritol kinase